MSKFIASWLSVAAKVLEAEFSRPVDLLPGAAIPADAPRLTLMAEIGGDWGGAFTVTIDASALARLLSATGKHSTEDAGDEGPAAELTAEAARESWHRLFRKICIDAAADLGSPSGRGCEVAMISPAAVEVAAGGTGGIGYKLRAGEVLVAMMIADQVEAAVEPQSRPSSVHAGSAETAGIEGPAAESESAAAETAATRGLDLLLGVELEASLRFGSREMALSDLLALGPGDVIQLDRALADPVDLIIGDKIVARGEVVLVNGNFGLQVTEVAEPRKSLESIRCLF